MSLTAVKIQTEAGTYLQDTDWTSEEKDAFIQGFTAGAWWAEKEIYTQQQDVKVVHAWRRLNTPLGPGNEPTPPKCSPAIYKGIVIPALIRMGAIPKSELKVGHQYKGYCRNASTAIWLGDKFEYQRYKFGETFPEKINHFEDDNGYDLFVPYKDLDHECDIPNSE